MADDTLSPKQMDIAWERMHAQEQADIAAQLGTFSQAEPTATEARIEVHPCACWTESECFPCIAVEVFRKNQKPQRTWVDLKELGKHFDTPELARDAAKRVRVISVSIDGDVTWVFDAA